MQPTDDGGPEPCDRPATARRPTYQQDTARFRPGERRRLIYRTPLYRGRKGEPKAFGEPDLIRLPDVGP